MPPFARPVLRALVRARASVLASVVARVLASALVLLSACAASPPLVAPREAGLSAADRAEIAGVLDRQIAAWNRGDLDAYMDGYARTPALVFTSGGNVRRGWQDAYDHYKARYATDPGAHTGTHTGTHPDTMGTLAFRVESIDPVGTGGAVVLGRWELTGTPNGGRGVFTLVVEHRPEGWRVIHDHTSLGPVTP